MKLYFRIASRLKYQGINGLLISVVNKLCQKLLHALTPLENLEKLKPKYDSPEGIKTILISMIKNEFDIIETFCQHSLEMFDEIIFVDHNSNDGTWELLNAYYQDYQNIKLLRFKHNAYLQSELMTWVVHNVIPNDYAGWVFILDADEFLTFKSKYEFNQCLAKFNRHPIVKLPWLNLIPRNFGTNQISDREYLLPNVTSKIYKVCFQPNLINVKLYKVAQGNHAILTEGNLELPASDGFPIYHIPIRNFAQVENKVKQGLVSYSLMNRKERGIKGLHWFEMDNIINSNGITKELAYHFIYKYGESHFDAVGISLSELKKQGYMSVNLILSTCEMAKNVSNKPMFKTSIKNHTRIKPRVLDYDASTKTIYELI